MKTKYCLGFLFSFCGGPPVVVLINKNRPKWQAGKLNGIGGKVEAGEHPGAAMRREFEEETGVRVKNWTPFAEMIFDDCEVFCFAAQDDDLIFDIHSMTDEKVGIYETTCLDSGSEPVALENLSWLVPMAISSLTSANVPLPILRIESL